MTVLAKILASLTTASRKPAPSVREPYTQGTLHEQYRPDTESNTPHPSTEANVSAAIKYRVLLRASRL